MMKNEKDTTKNIILIKNNTIIDGAEKEPYKASVIVKGNKIYKIVTDSINEATIDEIIDASGMYLLPGMIDCHVHAIDPS